MQRIVYLCPADNSPVGGIKVIYRHVEALNRIGIPAFILHPHALNFRCSWFKNDAPCLNSQTLDRFSDYIVIPDIFALSFGLRCKEMHYRYAIFVQNGYLLYPASDNDAAPLHSVIEGANLILSISADTDRMLQCNFPGLDEARLARVTSSIPDCFSLNDIRTKETAPKLITYMPRKMPDHARRVVYALRQNIPPEWGIHAIHNVNEATCAAMLTQSRVFLSFSDLEGLALPPLEAALAGNLVIGYTGQGGAEYWDVPNFQAIAQGDIVGFVRAAQAVVMSVDSGLIGQNILSPGIAKLAHRFSANAELELLRIAVGRMVASWEAPTC